MGRRKPDAAARGAQRHAGKERRGLAVRQIAVGGEALEVEPPGGAVEQGRERGLVARRFHRGDGGDALGLGAAARRREDVDDPPAGDRAPGRLVAQNDRIAVERADRPVEHELHERGLAGRDAALLQNGDAAGDIGGAAMDMDRRPMRQRPRLARQHPQPRVDFLHGRRHVSGHDPVAAGDLLGMEIADEIEGAALTRLPRRGARVLRVDRPHPRGLSGEQQPHLIARRERARNHRARHHEPGADDAEGPIDGEAEIAVPGPRRDRALRRDEMLLEIADPRAADGGDGKDGRVGERRLGQQIGDVARRPARRARAARGRSW